MRKHTSYKLLIADLVIICFSLFLSLVVRSNLYTFVYDVSNLLYLAPYIVLFRLLINVLFRYYKNIYIYMYPEETLLFLFRHLIPSIILLGLRLFSPLQELRFPISMIVFEFSLSVMGLYFIRILYVFLKGKHTIKYNNRYIVLGQVTDFEHSYEYLQNNNVVGIISNERNDLTKVCYGVPVLAYLGDKLDRNLLNTEDILLILDKDLLDNVSTNLNDLCKNHQTMVFDNNLNVIRPLEPYDFQKPSFAIPESIKEFFLERRILITGLRNRELDLIASINNALGREVFSIDALIENNIKIELDDENAKVFYNGDKTIYINLPKLLPRSWSEYYYMEKIKDLVITYNEYCDYLLKAIYLGATLDNYTNLNCISSRFKSAYYMFTSSTEEEAQGSNTIFSTIRADKEES